MKIQQRSKSYWERRAAERTVDYHADAERTANELGKAYQATGTYLSEEAAGVLRSFGKAFDLTEAEALEMLRNSPTADVREVLRRSLGKVTDPDKKRRIEALISAPAYSYRMDRLQALFDNTGEMCHRIYNAEVKTDTAFFRKEIDKAYKHTVFDMQKGMGISAPFDIMPKSRIDSILKTQWSGKHFSRRIWNNTSDLAEGLRHDMLVGIMTGQSEAHMTEALMSRCGSGAFEARRLVRTETTYITNQAELDGYRQTEIEKYEFSACLDNRTSEICNELDGKIFLVSVGKPGVNLPPMHPFCRSTTLPVLPTEDDLDREIAELTDEIGADVDFDTWVSRLEKGEDGKLRYVAESVDKFGKSDIMEMGSDDVALELQRYGRNKDTLVNKTYVDSGEYKRKFDNATSNVDVNKTLYDCAKQALKHRSGTVFEDMYWIDSDTGKIIAEEVSGTLERKVKYSSQTKKVVNAYERNKIIALHTHPSSMPPSVGDFNACLQHGYKCGYIACHDGTIFGYTCNEEINERLYGMYVEKYVKNSYTEYEAQILTLNEFKKTGMLDFWEVK